MAYTARQLITAAMQQLGVLTTGESPSSAEETDALTLLNAMIDSWSTERFNIYSIVPSVHALTTATQTYTIGSGGAFDVTRPVRYERATIRVPNTGGSGYRYHPLNIVNAQQWSEIVGRNAADVVPTTLFPDMAHPLTTLYLWPIPTFTTISIHLELWTWTQLQQFADIATTSYSFPPGYERALKLNFALEVASMFGVTPTPQLMQQAAEAKAAIRMLNAADPTATPATGQLNALAPAPVAA